MTASLQCRVLGQACIICIFCTVVSIVGCAVVTVTVLLHLLTDLAKLLARICNQAVAS